jgi:hypothetical protein
MKRNTRIWGLRRALLGLIVMVFPMSASSSGYGYANGIILAAGGDVEIIRKSEVYEVYEDFVIQSQDVINLVGNGSVTVQLSPTTAFRLETLVDKGRMRIIHLDTTSTEKVIILQVLFGRLKVMSRGDQVMVLTAREEVSISTALFDEYVLDVLYSADVIYLKEGQLDNIANAMGPCSVDGGNKLVVDQISCVPLQMYRHEYRYFNYFRRLDDMLVEDFEGYVGENLEEAE